MTAETIDFIAKTGLIEESSGTRKFWIVMETEIRGYEKKMLCSGECRYTIPMHFLSEDRSITAFYDFTGYIQMKQWFGREMRSYTSARDNQKQIKDVLQILAGILECIKGMENYLIFPERITVHPDTVFIDLNTETVALAFYPNESPETLQSRITGLIHELSGLVHSDETDLYLKKIEEFILMKNPGLDGMISFLGSLQREVSYIYWNTKNFRKIEDQETLPAQGRIEKSRKSSSFHLKTAAIQIILAAGLFAVFFSDRLNLINFAGLVIITGGIDLMVLRKRKTLDKKNI